MVTWASHPNSVDEHELRLTVKTFKEFVLTRLQPDPACAGLHCDRTPLPGCNGDARRRLGSARDRVHVVARGIQPRDDLSV